MPGKADQVRELLSAAGETYAAQAGIRLADKPAALYQLLVLSLLLSTRIKAEIAVAACRELISAGFSTPRKMRDASWQQRVDALGRAHYRRYDESTATRLGDGASMLLDRYGGDLRRLADRAGSGSVDDGRAGRTSELLQEFDGIGPVGADIFLREAQAVWPWLRPYLDERVQAAAEKFGLPTDARRLAELAGTADLSRLSAALMHASLDRRLRTRLTG